MHISGATRLRLLVALTLIIILWQILRMAPNWSLGNKEEIIIRPSGAPVLVMVFYEALCPDSKNFITKQLQTAYHKAASLIEYQLVPYGKATTEVAPDGSLSFTCQHGRVECNANIYHACVVEAVLDPSTQLNIVACMIRDNLMPKEAMQRCTKENHIDWEPIQKCFDTPHGAELLRIHGEATSALRPRVSFIPTITLDGSQGRQASILKDLFGEVCKVASGRGPMPDVCEPF